MAAASRPQRYPGRPTTTTLWTVTLDAGGNLTVHNALCEGIDSAKLPVTAPHF